MSDDVTRTLIANPGKLAVRDARDACLVHIYPSGSDMGRRYPLLDRTLVIGRADDAGIHIPDASVSRKHAQVDPIPGSLQQQVADGSRDLDAVQRHLVDGSRPHRPRQPDLARGCVDGEPEHGLDQQALDLFISR